MTGYTRSQLAEEIGSIRSQLEQVLEGDWRTVLDQAQQQAERAKGGKDPWMFQIHKEAPLRFRQTDSSETGIPVKVDISGIFRAPQNGRPVFDHSIVIRVWATSIEDWYNIDLDAPRLARKCIAQGRVVSRFLFDAVSSDKEPWFHLHFGGKDRQGHEYCRMPEALEVPRFLHHPMGLIQTCEFVLFHFYPEVHAAVSRDLTWRHALREAEKAYMQAYVEMIAPLNQKQPNRGSFLLHCCSDT